MLFTDGQFVTAADLEVIDGEIAAVAATANIVIDTSPQSIITRTLSEVGNDFTSKIQNFSGYLVGLGVNMNHNAAVLNILSTAINRPRTLLHQITVTEPDPTRLSFKHWADYYCLMAFYRNALHRKLIDRYEKKYNLYDKERRAVLGDSEVEWIPGYTIATPLPGRHFLEYGSGIWSQANGNLAAQTGSSQDVGAKWDVAITWVAQPPYVIGNDTQNGGESGPSAILSLTTNAKTAGQGDVLAVDITSLNPPVTPIPTAIGTAAGIWNRVSATHWNVYAGVSGSGRLTQQNASPLAIATKQFMFADKPTSTGFLMNPGQPAQYDFSLVDMTWRA